MNAEGIQTRLLLSMQHGTARNKLENNQRNHVMSLTTGTSWLSGIWVNKTLKFAMYFGLLYNEPHSVEAYVTIPIILNLLPVYLFHTAQAAGRLGSNAIDSHVRHSGHTLSNLGWVATTKTEGFCGFDLTFQWECLYHRPRYLPVASHPTLRIS